jgi:histidine triad (HIT) family protein
VTEEGLNGKIKSVKKALRGLTGKNETEEVGPSRARRESHKYMENCVFCKIINKELPATIIFENAEFIAFSPINQVSKGHTLLIPKKHQVNIFDMDKSLFERLAGVAHNLSKELMESNGAVGINLLNANGKDAQQSVSHFHLHIVPRYKNDGLDLWFRNKF